jgi:hypothetical protein
MRSVSRWTVAVGVVTLLAGSALAQPPGGPGGGRGGFGRGGFGGPGALLQNKSVQQELKLTDDQITKVKEVTDEIRSKHQEDFTKLRDISDQTERREKGAELMKTVGEETNKALAGVLKPEQEKRLKQIRLQTEGTRAFQDPEVEKALKLSDEQKDSLKTIEADARKEMEGLRGGQGNREENRKKFESLRQETKDKAAAVLNDTQKKEWKELTGEPFKLEQPEGGRGPGGRGGRGPRPTTPPQ